MKLSELKLKIKKKVNLTLFIPREDVDRLHKMLSDISLKDATFKFTIKKSSKYEQFFLAFIECDSRDVAFKRGTWITKKYLENTQKELFYKVSR